MNYCLISLEPIEDGPYSTAALKKLNRNLKQLYLLPYDQKEQHKVVLRQTDKISISGVQPKFSARLNVKDQVFTTVDRFGTFIIKPRNLIWKEFPENEAFTMRMADKFGLEVPPCGLVKCTDETLSYFIKRFDRHGKSGKYPVEDFSQLAELPRNKKYGYSIEKVIKLVDEHCTFPIPEKQNLLRIICFNLLFGNEDSHLKNYSLISKATAQGDVIHRLSPCYDLLNTMAVYLEVGNRLEEIDQTALTICGKKKKIQWSHLVTVCERMNLPESQLLKCRQGLEEVYQLALDYLPRSYMSETLQECYRLVLKHNWSTSFTLSD